MGYLLILYGLKTTLNNELSRAEIT